MTQRNKNIALLGVFVVLLFAIYNWSIKRTLNLKEDVVALREQQKSIANVPSKSLGLKVREIYLDSILSANNVKEGSVQSSLLELINTNPKFKGISISEFNAPHLYKKENSSIESFSFKLIGTYKEIESLIYTIEQDYYFGAVQHIQFEKKKDFRKNRNYLECFIVLSRVLGG